MATYSYSVQTAEFDPSRVDERGTANAREILAGFDAFDWPGQVDAANRLQKCSPTFSVKDVDEDRLLWVSGIGDSSGVSFINGYTYIGEIRRMFGLVRSRGPVGAPTRELSLAEARQAVELFTRAEHERLLALLAGR
jgi:hypothetical protein